MLIRAYGMFWERDEVDWQPGAGGHFRLLGRVGSKAQKLRAADFRDQKGLYVLHGNHGAYYVGVVTRGTLGKRLRDHTLDEHRNKWNRFSWFGFRQVLQSRNPDGTCRLKDLANVTLGEPSEAIKALESVLIQVLGTQGNTKQGRFPGADRWEQVKGNQVDGLLSRLRR
jgi:hypothetical protein